MASSGTIGLDRAGGRVVPLLSWRFARSERGRGTRARRVVLLVLGLWLGLSAVASVAVAILLAGPTSATALLAAGEALTLADFAIRPRRTA